MTKNDGPVGIKEIAHALGCSTRTIRRLHASGKAATFQVNGPTSPIKMTRVDLKRLQKRKGKE